MKTRQEIIELVRKYYREEFGATKFNPDSDRVHYAGRVFDEQELVTRALWTLFK